MRKVVLLLPTLLGCTAATVAAVKAQERIVTYEVSLPAPQTQMVEIAAVFPTEGEEAIEVMLPVWRPGRYTVLDLVSTVRSFRAESGTGEPLATEKVSKSAWRVETKGSAEVRVVYSVYANSIWDRTRHVDATHAFLSGTAVFVYTPRLRSARVRVVVDAPEGWDIACGLEKEPGQDSVLVAESYDVLVDSPLEIGLHDRHLFEVEGKPHEIVIWPPGILHDAERMKADLGRIVGAQAEIFGRMPYERYVFLIHVGAGGGGTEHLNSTIMQSSRRAIEGSLDNDDSYKRFLGLVSHEMFHTWNVKQLRPAGIHPYDYQRENYTDLLWVAEGGTSYYGGLTLARLGYTKEKKYIDGIARSVDSLRRRPGARVQSLAASSFDSWTHGKSSSDDVNTEISFYSKGLLAFLLLDMEVRGRTENRVGLDDVMKTMFERYPLDGPGYTTADLISVLDELTGTSFTELFARHIQDTEELPLEEALLAAGLRLHFEPAPDEDAKEEEEEADDSAEPAEPLEAAAKKPKLEPYLGLSLTSGGSGSRVSAVLSDGPAYTAGVLPGDEIIALNGRRLRSSDLDRRLERMEPGDEVTLHILRRDELMEISVALSGIPDGKWAIERVKEPTEFQKATYAAWIGHPWPEAKKKPETEAPAEPEKEDA